jgi:hypothetical protein
MSSTGYSLIGMLASRARLRFTGIPEHKIMDTGNAINYHRTVLTSFSRVSSDRVTPRLDGYQR